jgi:tRNA(fMet)-specific endonuclease VapC
MVVLDTDHVSLLERGRGDDLLRLRARLGLISPPDRVTTIITYEEQSRGWLAYVAGSRTLTHQVDAYRKLNHNLQLYRKIQVLEFDEHAATEFQRLRKLAVRVGTMDLKIAAIVLVHRAKLLSRNLADFHKIPNLDVEDWTS